MVNSLLGAFLYLVVFGAFGVAVVVVLYALIGFFLWLFGNFPTS